MNSRNRSQQSDLVNLTKPFGFNETLSKLNKTLEMKSTTKINPKCDYKLTLKFNLNVWLDSLRFELINSDLLDIIDENALPNKICSLNAQKKRINNLKDIIINHLDEFYHRTIMNLRDPKLIINTLEDFWKAETRTDSRKNETVCTARSY